MTKSKINLNKTFHPESVWDGLAERLVEDEYEGLTYDQARFKWRVAQVPYVIEGLAAEYKKLRSQGVPHEEVDEACYDGYLEYIRRWPVKSRKMRDEVAKIDYPDAVSQRPSKVQPDDEVIKGGEAIESESGLLLDLIDDSIIASNLIGELVDEMN